MVLYDLREILPEPVGLLAFLPSLLQILFEEQPVDCEALWALLAIRWNCHSCRAVYSDSPHWGWNFDRRGLSVLSEQREGPAVEAENGAQLGEIAYVQDMVGLCSSSAYARCLHLLFPEWVRCAA